MCQMDETMSLRLGIHSKSDYLNFVYLYIIKVHGYVVIFIYLLQKNQDRGIAPY